MLQAPTSARALTFLSLGVAAGVLGSKIAPIVASARAGRQTRLGGDPFQRLIEDHRAILETLDRMVDARSGSKAKRAKALVQLKTRLAKHALAEEDVVYPVMHDEAGRSEESEHLYYEHSEMKRLLFGLEQSLDDAKEWDKKAELLRDLIRQHAREEEEQVFPFLRRSMKQERLPELSSQIAREESMIFSLTGEGY